MLQDLCRGELFAALCILGFANGVAGRVYGAVAYDGLAVAVVNTFNISAVVWAAFIACPVLLFSSSKEQITRHDLLVAACALGAFLLPLTPVSWVTLTGLAFYLLRSSPAIHSQQFRFTLHRSAWILLATTGTMFWGRVLLLSVSGPILGADAILISWLTGTERAGNALSFADGQGYIWIAPGCSSLSNISLAMLCWVLFAQIRGLGWSLRSLSWCLLACSSVIMINVIRIGLMVMHREQFDFIHGPTGATLTNWLSVAAVLGVCLYGTRRGRLARA